MGTAAASGGYYAAAPATLIVANSGTITGSIGVRAQYVNLQGLLEKLGLKSDILASGKMKAAGDPTQPLTPEQRAYIQALIMDLHQQFVSDVAAARGLPEDEVAKLADGRAYTGRQALKLKLVDQLGGQELAMRRMLVSRASVLCRISAKARFISSYREVNPRRSLSSWLRRSAIFGLSSRKFWMVCTMFLNRARSSGRLPPICSKTLAWSCAFCCSENKSIAETRFLANSTTASQSASSGTPRRSSTA